MSKKIIYLLLALAVPGLIFIFLKIFGRNHFDIPVYYQEGILDLPKECSGDFRGQYILPDSILNAFGYRNGTACLFVDASEIDNKEIKFLKLSFNDQLQVIALSGFEEPRLSRVKNCILFLKDPWRAVLMDRQKRIRGYYAFTNLEETDRLKVEVEILLTNN